MKIDKTTLTNMQKNCLTAWNRLLELYPDLQGKLNEKTASDLWFKTWCSIAYDDNNPNVLRNESGMRLFAHNPRFELYPCNSDDQTMKAAYKRIYKYITEAK